MKTKYFSFISLSLFFFVKLMLHLLAEDAVDAAALQTRCDD